VSTTPGEGAVLASPPPRVTIRFDDTVRVLGGTTVVANSGKRPVTAGRPSASGRVVTIRLRKLRDGDYTVRWSVLSDDGHTVDGVFAFAVGAGRAPPSAALSAGSSNLTRNVISRWFFFAGLLIAVGVVLFIPLAWRPAFRAAGADQDERALWPLAFAGFFLAFLGASSLIPHHGAGTTRFGLAYEVGGIVAIIGATLSAIALVERRLWRGVFVCALALLPIPSVAGHALDRGQWPRPLNVAADILHVGAAAVWIGGLLALAIGLPRAARRLSAEQRVRFSAVLVPRLSAIALGSVAVIAVTGLIRALSELSAVSQLWSSGYGRALVVKTCLLALLVSLGWINRSRLVPRLRLEALRRNVAVELVVLAGLVIAVAFLTDLAPGHQLARAVASPQAPQPVADPPPGATVLAGESGDRAVGLAIRPGGRLQATVLGPDDNGVDGLSVAFRETSVSRLRKRPRQRRQEPFALGSRHRCVRERFAIFNIAHADEDAGKKAHDLGRPPERGKGRAQLLLRRDPSLAAQEAPDPRQRRRGDVEGAAGGPVELLALHQQGQQPLLDGDGLIAGLPVDPGELAAVAKDAQLVLEPIDGTCELSEKRGASMPGPSTESRSRPRSRGKRVSMWRHSPRRSRTEVQGRRSNEIARNANASRSEDSPPSRSVEERCRHG